MYVVDDSSATALLGALAQVSRAFIDRAARLRVEPGWSEVTHELAIIGPLPDDQLPHDVREALQDLRPGRHLGIVISGYVDAKLIGQHGAAWAFDIAGRSPSGWRVSRDVNLYPLEREDVVYQLADVDFRDWLELANALPGLIEELLAAPLPSPTRGAAAE